MQKGKGFVAFEDIHKVTPHLRHSSPHIAVSM
jgi:hypothetical protein